MRESNGNSETGKYLDRKGEAAEKTALSGGYNLVSHHPIFIFKIESIVVCEPKSKDVEEDTERRENRS